MSDLFFRKSKTIFDRLEENDIEILKEAPEDGDDAAADAGAADAAPADDAGGDDAGGDDANTDDNADNADNADDEDMGSDEDFDVDTSIDDDGGDDNGDTGDDAMDTGGTSGDIGDGEEEVNAKNTNIFSTLSAEEQAIKISELKKIFNDLYIYITDMLGKINDINPDEDNLEAIYRVTSGLYDLEQNIGHYIKNIFPLKSYIENDIAYNRYLVIVRSITNVLNDVASEMEAKAQKEEKK